MTAVIHTEQLTKSYGAHRGITELDLDVEEGEIFGFLGPNGAGKTTTMRVLLDLIRPTSGRAEVFGIETTADPVAIHRRIGYLPGEFDLYDRLTGADTIAYFANLRGGVDPGYVAELIERLDLDPSRRFKEYSKGNKQKVGLVVALQHRPDLLILDEPTSGLDPLVQQTFFEIVREARAEGRTVFLSSHIIDEVDRTCDRVAIIREGRLVQVDRIEAIRRLAFHHVELTFAAPVAAGDLRVDRRRERRGGRWATSSRMRVAGPIGAVTRRRGAARPRRRREPRAEPRGRLPRPVRCPRWPLTLVRCGAGRVHAVVAGHGPPLDLRQDRPRQPSRRARRRRPGRPVHAGDRGPVRPGVRRRWRSASSFIASMTALPLALRGLLGRAHQHRDARRLHLLARRQHPAGDPGAVVGAGAVRHARRRGREGQPGPAGRRRRTSRRSIALQKLAGHVTALVGRDAALRGRSRGSPGSPSRCCRATTSRFSAAARAGAAVRAADAGRRIDLVRDWRRSSVGRGRPPSG